MGTDSPHVPGFQPGVLARGEARESSGVCVWPHPTARTRDEYIAPLPRPPASPPFVFPPNHVCRPSRRYPTPNTLIPRLDRHKKTSNTSATTTRPTYTYTQPSPPTASPRKTVPRHHDSRPGDLRLQHLVPDTSSNIYEARPASIATMYGSYGSYSSMSQMSAPLDIVSSQRSSSQEFNCAFPSWPRRSSLSESDCVGDDHRATSYLSDEDLFPCAVDDDSDARSVSSAGSVTASPRAAPTEAEMLELQRERDAYQREVVRFLVNERERRRQQAQMARRARRSSGGAGQQQQQPRKSPKTKLSNMTPIAEATGE